MEKYYSHVQTDKGKEFLEVKGKPVIIPGFENFDFFICRAYKDPPYWDILEGQTGLSIINKSMRTQKETIAEARRVLGLEGREKLITAIKRGIASMGVSPRYAKGSR